MGEARLWFRRLAGKLCGPRGIVAFDDETRERCPGVFPGALSGDEVEGLFSLARLERALAGPGTPVAQADLYTGQHLLRLSDIHRRSGRSPAAVAAEHLATGATLRFRDIDRFDPALGAFAAAIAEIFAAKVQINVYLTPPAHAGFPPHFDNTDVFVLQVAGAKVWHLHRNYTNRVPLPDPDMPWDPDAYKPTGEPETHLLRAGDVLYLPRGEMHSARCTEAESLHLTVSLVPLTIADLLTRELRRLALEEEGLRRRARWSVMGDVGEEAQLGETLRGWLPVLAERIDPARSLAAERVALTTHEEEDASALSATVGALKDANAERQIT